jgi:DNA-damage-inducible protein J
VVKWCYQDLSKHLEGILGTYNTMPMQNLTSILDNTSTEKEVDDMTTVSLRFDDKMKKELDEMCDEMGMNLTTFFMIYAKKALRDRKIPFELEAPGKADPIEQTLDEADVYAATNATRMTHEEVFVELRAMESKLIQGSDGI